MAKKPTNTFYNVTNKTEDEVTIHLFGEVGWDNTWWGDGTNNEAWAFVKLLKDLDKDYKTVHLHINSPGGDIAQGLAIYNTIRDMKAEVHTHNRGLVASMATIIYLAGDITHHPKTAISHFHRASTIVWGNANDMEQTIKTLETFESTLIEAISRRTSLSAEEIKTKWLTTGEDYYLTGDEMKELGFVDHITDDNKAKPPVEDFSNFKNVIAAYSKQDKPQKRNFLDKISAALRGETYLNDKSDKSIDTPMANKLKISNVALAVAIEAFELPSDENGNVTLSSEQFNKLTGLFENGKKADEDLKAMTAERDALQAEKTELEAKLANIPTDKADASDPRDTASNRKEDLEVYVDPIDVELAENGI